MANDVCTLFNTSLVNNHLNADSFVCKWKECMGCSFPIIKMNNFWNWMLECLRVFWIKRYFCFNSLNLFEIYQKVSKKSLIDFSLIMKCRALSKFSMLKGSLLSFWLYWILRADGCAQRPQKVFGSSNVEFTFSN